MNTPRMFVPRMDNVLRILRFGAGIFLAGEAQFDRLTDVVGAALEGVVVFLVECVEGCELLQFLCLDEEPAFAVGCAPSDVGSVFCAEYDMRIGLAYPAVEIGHVDITELAEERFVLAGQVVHSGEDAEQFGGGCDIFRFPDASDGGDFSGGEAFDLDDWKSGDIHIIKNHDLLSILFVSQVIGGDERQIVFFPAVVDECDGQTITRRYLNGLGGGPDLNIVEPCEILESAGDGFCDVGAFGEEIAYDVGDSVVELMVDPQGRADKLQSLDGGLDGHFVTDVSFEEPESDGDSAGSEDHDEYDGDGLEDSDGHYAPLSRTASGLFDGR